MIMDVDDDDDDDSSRTTPNWSKYFSIKNLYTTLFFLNVESATLKRGIRAIDRMIEKY